MAGPKWTLKTQLAVFFSSALLLGLNIVGRNQPDGLAVEVHYGFPFPYFGEWGAADAHGNLALAAEHNFSILMLFIDIVANGILIGLVFLVSNRLFMRPEPRL